MAWVAMMEDYGAMVLAIEDLRLIADFLPSTFGLAGLATVTWS